MNEFFFFWQLNSLPVLMAVSCFVRFGVLFCDKFDVARSNLICGFYFGYVWLFVEAAREWSLVHQDHQNS